MLAFLAFLLLAALVALFIWLLHRNQQRRVQENAELNAPLPGIENDLLPDFAGQTPDTTVATGDNWQQQVRSLRESQALDAALALCREHFPRATAFQQAALILRQQIREGVERKQPVAELLRELYHIAALADLFRSANRHKAANPDATLAALRERHFDYHSIGHQRLRLLNKGDGQALEQLWGTPASHHHVEEVLGEEWHQLRAAPEPARPAGTDVA